MLVNDRDFPSPHAWLMTYEWPFDHPASLKAHLFDEGIVSAQDACSDLRVVFVYAGHGREEGAHEWLVYGRDVEDAAYRLDIEIEELDEFAN